MKTEDDDSVLQNATPVERSTLPERMRAAAETLVEASKRYSEEHGLLPEQFEATSWDAANLRVVADRWETLDAEQAAADALAIELARTLYDAGWHQVTERQVRPLIDDGWTKQ